MPSSSARPLQDRGSNIPAVVAVVCGGAVEAGVMGLTAEREACVGGAKCRRERGRRGVVVGLWITLRKHDKYKYFTSQYSY